LPAGLAGTIQAQIVDEEKAKTATNRGKLSLSCGENLMLTLLEAIQITIAALRTQTLRP
jgi:hypothetical protein